MYMCDTVCTNNRKCSPLEEVDSSEDSRTDLGEEWPTFEDEEVARQREFIQVYLASMSYDRYTSLHRSIFILSVGVVLCKEITPLRWKQLLRSVQYIYTHTLTQHD